MRMIPTLATVLALLLTTATSAQNHSMTRHNKEFIISGPTTLTVVNPYGDVRLRKADDDMLIFHGVAQNTDEHQITVEFTEDKGAIQAIVKHSHPDAPAPTTRFDLALILPVEVDLDIQFEKGQLSGKGLQSNIKARSEAGHIQLKTTGSVDVFTKTGNIQLKLKSGSKSLNSQIQSISGAVTVMYQNHSPRFDVITGDHVTSNSIPLLQSKQPKGRHLMFGSNEGSNPHLIHIKTDTGPIRLIEMGE